MVMEVVVLLADVDDSGAVHGIDESIEREVVAGRAGHDSLFLEPGLDEPGLRGKRPAAGREDEDREAEGRSHRRILIDRILGVRNEFIGEHGPMRRTAVPLLAVAIFALILLSDRSEDPTPPSPGPAPLPVEPPPALEDSPPPPPTAEEAPSAEAPRRRRPRKPGGTVTGFVYDAEGNPVAGARVTAPDYKGEWRPWIDGSRAATTDAQGRFELGDVRASERKILYARREGLGAGASERFRVVAEQVTTGIDIRFRPAWTVVFDLIPPVGDELPKGCGADVVLALDDDDVRALRQAAIHHVRAEGSVARVWGLARGPVTLHVWAEGYRGQRFRTTDVLPPEGEKERRVEVRLDRGLSIRGRGDKRDRKLCVLATRETRDYLGRPPFAHTDAEGRFEIPGLVPGAHRVRVREHRFTGANLADLPSVPAGTDDLVIPLSGE
jgi:hypothetical protein